MKNSEDPVHISFHSRTRVLGRLMGQEPPPPSSHSSIRPPALAEAPSQCNRWWDHENSLRHDRGPLGPVVGPLC